MCLCMFACVCSHMCLCSIMKGSYVILRGATQAAGLALDALPAISPHRSRHVHCELQTGRVAWVHTHTHAHAPTPTHTHTQKHNTCTQAHGHTVFTVIASVFLGQSFTIYIICATSRLCKTREIVKKKEKKNHFIKCNAFFQYSKVICPHFILSLHR